MLRKNETLNRKVLFFRFCHYSMNVLTNDISILRNNKSVAFFSHCVNRALKTSIQYTYLHAVVTNNSHM